MPDFLLTDRVAIVTGGSRGIGEATARALAEHVAAAYGPAVEGTSTRLFVARQWNSRDVEAERQLCGTPGVTGLVFSSFRHSNPDAVRRGDFRAGRVSGVRS